MGLAAALRSASLLPSDPFRLLQIWFDDTENRYYYSPGKAAEGKEKLPRRFLPLAQATGMASLRWFLQRTLPSRRGVAILSCLFFLSHDEQTP
jgi:hypothetical protein